jgi:hypothetical protein
MARALNQDRAPLPSTTKIVYIARAFRDFADGFAVLLVPFYLAARGLGALE